MIERGSDTGTAPVTEPRLTRDALALPFRAAEKPLISHRIGIEVEKFALHEADGTAVDYATILSLFATLLSFGYREVRETAAGPVIALSREKASVTLEPGGQVELSGSPLLDLHAVFRELTAHHRELQQAATPLGIAFCSLGFHPLATPEQLPWVPKLRYRIMREYLQRLGSGTIDMMQRTATVQVNLDYGSEPEAMRKLCLGLRLSPIIHAMTANAPLSEGRLSPSNSLRGDVWMHMDPSRTGLIDRLWENRILRYDDYIEWALDAGMFLFKRNGNIVANTGQTFRDFLRYGYQGHFATLSDWRLHLNTLFPEVRLKNTLELRSADAQPMTTLMSVPGLWVGLLADEQAMAEAEAVAQSYDLAEMREARPALIQLGYASKLAGRPLAYYAERLLTIAHQGLTRRQIVDEAARDETQYLAGVTELFEKRQTPGALLRERLKNQDLLDARHVVEIARLF